MQKPQPIRLILEKTLKDLEIDIPLKSYSIFGAWKEVVGESVANQTQPRAIRNRILFLDVSHPTWMQQLQFLKPTLLEKINHYLGEPLIQDIRFKLGKISHPLSSSSETSSLEKEKLDKDTINLIESALQKIEDEELKKELRHVLIKGAKLEQLRKKLG
ncbi:MAG: DciA family protein [Thermodesulfobacteriota bacterium]